MSAFTDIPQPLKAGLDISLVSYAVAALAGAAPAIGAVAVAIYYIIQVWESATVQKIAARLARVLIRKQMTDAISKGAPVSVEVQPVLVVGPVPTPPPLPTQSPAEQEPAKPA